MSDIRLGGEFDRKLLVGSFINKIFHLVPDPFGTDGSSLFQMVPDGFPKGIPSGQMVSDGFGECQCFDFQRFIPIRSDP
jgi:hypothetical protein